MRLVTCLSFAALLFMSTAAHAQHVTVGGWVQRVDIPNATITIRTLANPRTISVAPNAVIRVNGVVSRLEQLPLNSSVSIVAEPDPDGVLRATQIVVQTAERQPAASAPPGAIVRGTIMGINLPVGTITVRTTAGDYPVSLGTAPIYVNETLGSSRDLRLGEAVEVVRTLPTAASTEYVTQTVRVLPRASGAAGTARRTAAYSRTSAAQRRRAASGSAGRQAGSSATAGMTGAGLIDRGQLLLGTRGYAVTVRTGRYGATSRTAGYRRTYRRTRTRTYVRTRRTHYRTRYSRTRRVHRLHTNQPM